MNVPTSYPKNDSETIAILSKQYAELIYSVLEGQKVGFIVFRSPEGIIKFRECDTTDFETFKIKNK